MPKQFTWMFGSSYALPMLSTYRVLLTTCGSNDEAQKIANALVERRLAACVNIVPNVQSVYRWNGKVENAQEWLLVVKTSVEHVTAIEAALRELHSYELPECMWLDISGGSAAYLGWLEENL